MPAVLSEHQHELLTLDESRSIVFGTEDTGYLTLVRPVFGGGDMRTGDVDRPQEDGVMFARDFTTPKTVVFEIGVLTDLEPDPHRANLSALDVLQGWWRDERLRKDPWTLAVLRSHEAGQTWRCYGRPRRFEEVAGPLTARGYTPVVCDFGLTDDRVYADEPDEVEVGLHPPPEPGFTTPIVFPLTTIRETTGDAVATIDTARSTWPWVTFTGPCTNPALEVGDLMVIGLVGSIPALMSVTVDPRPWRRSITRNDGANLAGWLSPTSPPLRDMLLSPPDEPGEEHALTYRAIDATGTSTATLRWRAARSRP